MLVAEVLNEGFGDLYVLREVGDEQRILLKFGVWVLGQPLALSHVLERVLLFHLIFCKIQYFRLV